MSVKAHLSCVYENSMEKSTLYKHSGLHPKTQLHILNDAHSAGVDAVV